MKKASGWAVATLLLGATLALPTAAHSSPDDELLLPAPRGNARYGSEPLEADEIRERPVQINSRALSRASGQSQEWSPMLTLFDGTTMQARLRAEPGTGKSATWTGYLLEDPNSTVVATYRDGALTADIWTSDATYRLRSADGDIHRLVEVDRAARLPELEPVTIDRSQLRAPTGPPDGETATTPDAANQPATLDLLFAYTPDARQAARTTASLEAQVENMVAWLNLALANSRHPGRARVVGVVPTSFRNTTGSLLDSLESLQRGEGDLAALHAERDARGADVVMLLQEEGDACGLAYVLQDSTPTFSDYAFGVVLRQCTTSLAHEVGHLLGAQHEKKTTTGHGLFPFSHGAVDRKVQWRTTMSTQRQCHARGVECTRIPYFSDPQGRFLGAALGDPDLADNSRTLAGSWDTLTSFRNPAVTIEIPAAIQLRSRSNRVVVRWQKAAGASAYRVLRSTDGGDFSPLAELGGSATRFVDRNPDGDDRATQCYQIVAVADNASALTAPSCVVR